MACLRSGIPPTPQRDTRIDTIIVRVSRARRRRGIGGEHDGKGRRDTTAVLLTVPSGPGNCERERADGRILVKLDCRSDPTLEQHIAGCGPSNFR